MEKTVVELFAGVGGFRLGLMASSTDWKFVMANQWEPGKKKQWAFDCYSKRFVNGQIVFPHENEVEEEIQEQLSLFDYDPGEGYGNPL